jgi:predicted nucleic acid-binding protein
VGCEWCLDQSNYQGWYGECFIQVLAAAANRPPEQVSPDAVADVLSTLALVDVENGDLVTAPLLPGRLRSADAIHLATALRVDAHAMVVYDEELSSAAKTAGIRVLSPR